MRSYLKEYTDCPWQNDRKCFFLHSKPFCDQRSADYCSLHILGLINHWIETKDGARLHYAKKCVVCEIDFYHEFHLDIKEIGIAIGRFLMKQCRQDEGCPTKALLPEYDGE